MSTAKAGDGSDVNDRKQPDNPDPSPALGELPPALRGDPIAEHLRAQGRPVTKATWLECAYGSSNEVALQQDKETREWVRRTFPRDPHEPVG